MRKGIIFILFFILFFADFLFSVEVRIKVLTPNGNPVVNAEIRIYGIDKVYVTDENGECVLEIEEKKPVRLKIFHPLYHEKELIFRLPLKEEGFKIIINPLIMQREEIIVTTTRYPETSLKMPVAEKALTKDIIEEKGDPTIEQVLTGAPGVSSIGSGGYSKVPALRGIARKRLLFLVENSRVFSDRRTGPNASFIDPEEIERIEVVKSPLSVQYGSDAMGGVIHTFMKNFPEKGIEGRVNLKYGFNGEEKKGGFQIGKRFGKKGIFLSVNFVDSEDYSSPQEKISMSHFSRTNTFLRFGHKDENRDLSFGFLLSRGIDIGKPTVDSLTSPTYYPRENHNLVFINWREKGLKNGEFFIHFSFNPNFLETLTENFKGYKTGETFARTESIDHSFQASFSRNFFEKMKISFGLDSFLRNNCNAINIYRNFSEKGELISVKEEKSVKNGFFGNAGIFLTLDYWGFKPFDIVAGVRNDFFRLKSDVSDPSIKNSVKENALTGFFGASLEIKKGIYLFSNFSTAFRIPDISERFYTGITGRGFIIGNPDLKSERSKNIEGGLKIARDNYFAGIYLFNYSMKNLVERYRKEGKIYTYGNLDEGTLKGFEAEIEYFPLSGFKIFSNFHWIKGESKVRNAPLNDVPPPSILAGSRIWKGRFWGELNCYAQRKHDRPGPSEIAIPGFSIFNFNGGYYYGSKRIFVSIRNIFNKTYKGRPDPDSKEEPGRSISINFVYDFR